MFPAPILDVIPIQYVPLNGHDVARIILVLTARPPELGNDYVFGRREPEMPAKQWHGAPAVKTGLIMRVL